MTDTSISHGAGVGGAHGAVVGDLVDPAALERLRVIATVAARELDEVAAQRLHAARVDLARCHGPFADELADALRRMAAEENELAEACRRLARSAEAATAAAARDAAARDVAATGGYGAP